MVVTDIIFLLVRASPIDPKINPLKKRAKYGRLAKMPACDMLKPSTYIKEQPHGISILSDRNKFREFFISKLSLKDVGSLSIRDIIGRIYVLY